MIVARRRPKLILLFFLGQQFLQAIVLVGQTGLVSTQLRIFDRQRIVFLLQATTRFFQIHHHYFLAITGRLRRDTIFHFPAE
jgi:hypothetical protein